MSIFWNSVKTLLEQKHDYQWLASQTGLSKRTIENWIYRDRIPKADIADSIAKAFNTSIEFLLTGNPKLHSFPPDYHKTESGKKLLQIIKDERLLSIASCLPEMSDAQLKTIEAVIDTMCIHPITKETPKSAG